LISGQQGFPFRGGDGFSCAPDRVIWNQETFDGSDGTVAVGGGIVYEAEACDQLSAFDAVTGALNWFDEGICTGGGGATPAIYQDKVWERDFAVGNLVVNLDGSAASGFAALVAPSFHAGNAFYLAGRSPSTLSAVDLTTNTLKWSFVGDLQLCTSAAIAGGGDKSSSATCSSLIETGRRPRASVSISFRPRSRRRAQKQRF
jgi:outer membrane protein assembly factor BamB